MVVVVVDMFYCFIVKKEYSDFFGFLWYEDNKIGNRLREYRLKVYVFGNSFFFVIVLLGFKRIVEMLEESYGLDVGEFI